MRSIKWVLLFIGLVALTVLISQNASADTHTLAASGNAGDAGTWDNGVPGAGDDLVLTGAYNLALNQAITYGNITLQASYSGVATQGAVDFGYINFNMAGGTWTGANTNWQICSGSWVKTAGTVSSHVLKLNMTGAGSSNFGGSTFYALNFESSHTLTNSVTITWLVGSSFSVDADAIVTVNNGCSIYLKHFSTSNMAINNQGYITNVGSGNVQVVLNDASKNIGDLGRINNLIVTSGAATSYTLTLTDDNTGIGKLNLYSTHGTATCSFDLNGFNLTSDTLIVGTRGILICGEGTIRTASLDSSSGTVINETATWVFTDNALIKMAAGGTLYDADVNGTSLRLGSDVTMNSLTFCGLTASHPYGLYINGTRTSSVTTTSSGTYSLGAGVFAWDNATLKITPVITIDLWEHTDTFRNTVWQGYDYWADHDCDLLVTWSMTASEDWLTIDDTGNITGTPDEDGTCYYTITVTYSNGETATVSGYVDVVTSASQASTMAVSSMLGALVLVLIVGSVIVMINRSQRS